MITRLLPLALTGCLTSPTTALFDRDGDGIPVGADCNDQDSTIGSQYIDRDGDGFGSGLPTSGCDGDQWSDTNDDCDDTNPTTFPGATERCDDVDSSCDGVNDDASKTVFYRDSDSDEAGDPGTALAACTQPDGYVKNALDCDDDDPQRAATFEEVCDGKDNDCDDRVDEELSEDWYLDQDGDGFGVTSNVKYSCAQPSGYASLSGDCNDSSKAIFPGAEESCNGLDDSCDGEIDEGAKDTFYPDVDQDGYGSTADGIQACARPADYLNTGGDCDDDDPEIHPEVEDPCDTVDNDCDGVTDEDGLEHYYPDADGDGYGDAHTETISCEPQSGYLVDGSDCDDGDANTNPAAVEACDGFDNNCDLQVDEGFDQDGDGFTSCLGDCDDTQFTVNALATESCNGQDDDCDSMVDEDRYDPNDFLSSPAYLGNLDDLDDYDGIPRRDVFNATLTDTDQEDYYKILLEDDFYIGSDLFAVTVKLTNIPEGADYDLYLYWDDPDDGSAQVNLVSSSQQLDNLDEEVYVNGVSGPDNGGYYYIEVQAISGAVCGEPYQLVIENKD